MRTVGRTANRSAAEDHSLQIVGRLKPCGVTRADPSTLVTIAVVRGAVALAASALPAWRSARAAPSEALRGE